tara:strand:+ start:185 stop:772 length:588 start_codon:yes stop_codon:yes gene_type:complete
METKTTLTALLLAAVMVMPSYGAEWVEITYEDVLAAGREKREKTSVPESYFRISHDDFEGEDVFTTKLYPEDADGYQLLISTTDPNKTSQATYLYLSLSKQYFPPGKIVGSGRSGALVQQTAMRWFTPDDFRFKTDVMDSPRDCPNATWVATRDVKDLLNGKKLLVRIKTGDRMIEKSFSLENEAVAQTLTMLKK